jgi:outer membrane protein
LNNLSVSVLTGVLLMASLPAAAEMKIGFVNTERIFREAAPAVRAQKKLEKEFEKRDQELQRLAKQLQAMQENLEKNSVTLAESDRRNKEREFADNNREFQRKQREFREDLNQRRNEELASVLERANKSIKSIAEAEKFDIIFQEAVYANPRIDITEKVIKALSDAPAAPEKTGK